MKKKCLKITNNKKSAKLLQGLLKSIADSLGNSVAESLYSLILACKKNQGSIQDTLELYHQDPVLTRNIFAEEGHETTPQELSEIMWALGIADSLLSELE